LLIIELETISVLWIDPRKTTSLVQIQIVNNKANGVGYVFDYYNAIKISKLLGVLQNVFPTF
jgi:hypothetical protein